MMNGRLSNALDVVAKDLVVTLCATLSETLSSTSVMQGSVVVFLMSMSGGLFSLARRLSTKYQKAIVVVCIVRRPIEIIDKEP